MSYYCNAQELARRITWLGKCYAEYRHFFPILSWSYQNKEEELMKLLQESNVVCRLGTGTNYDSYAEGDCDLYIMTNEDSDEYPLIEYGHSICNKDDANNSGVNIIIEGACLFYPMTNAPDAMRKLTVDMATIPVEQQEILQGLYPNSWKNYKFTAERRAAYRREVAY